MSFATTIPYMPYPNISDAKIKEGIFVGSQIRKLMNDRAFEESLNLSLIHI